MHIGYFVNGFDSQQRRIHIHGHQAKIGKLRRLLHKSKIELRIGTVFRDVFPPARIFQPESLTGDTLDMIGASELRQFS